MSAIQGFAFINGNYICDHLHGKQAQLAPLCHLVIIRRSNGVHMEAGIPKVLEGISGPVGLHVVILCAVLFRYPLRVFLSNIYFALSRISWSVIAGFRFD